MHAMTHPERADSSALDVPGGSVDHCRPDSASACSVKDCTQRWALRALGEVVPAPILVSFNMKDNPGTRLRVEPRHWMRPYVSTCPRAWNTKVFPSEGD